MIKATIFTHPALFKNRQFDHNDPILSRNGDMYPFHLLRTRLEERGIELSTQDINSPESSSFVLFNEMPPKPAPTSGRRYLLLFECEVIRPDNWDLARHRDFDKIFTWHDGLVDNEKYFKINFPRTLRRSPASAPNEREKLCVMIAGNKFVRPHPLELYSRRIEAIRWFEKHHPTDFDLFGIGWDAPLTAKMLAKAVLYGRYNYIFSRRFPSYRGHVQDKIQVMREYKFAICYENAREIPGYITEKMMDCFLAGCVPVYWGAPNVGAHIPSDAFIDFRNFRNYEDMYRYLERMPDTEYRAYLESIDRFLSSEQAKQFTDEFFVEQLLNVILNDQAAVRAS